MVIGAGTIGLLILAAARHRNAASVVMTDVLESKRERARRLGADSVLDARHENLVEAVRAELGESADATNLPEDFRDAMEIIAGSGFSAEDYVTATYPLEEAAAAFGRSLGW